MSLAGCWIDVPFEEFSRPDGRQLEGFTARIPGPAVQFLS
jgi:hypothetical protein